MASAALKRPSKLASTFRAAVLGSPDRWRGTFSKGSGRFLGKGRSSLLWGGGGSSRCGSSVDKDPEDDAEEEEDECAICLEALSMMHQTTLHCGHVFHTECLDDLRIRSTAAAAQSAPGSSPPSSSSCPLCRAPIPDQESSLSVGQQASERFTRLMRSCGSRRARGWAGLTSAEQHELEAVIQLWRQGAFAGDPSCNYCLGVMAHDGLGVPVDEAEAVRNWRIATEKGHAKSQYRLGVMYLEGRGGVPHSDLAAERLFSLASSQGHAAAQLSLSQLYLSGRAGVAQSEYEADRLYARSAEQGMGLIRSEAAAGNAEAQYDLGCFHRDGRDCEQSWTHATDWFRRAAQSGHVGAQYALGTLCMGSDDVEAVRWLRRAADFGHAGSLSSLGTVYERGACGIPRDEREAARLYRLAAKLGDPIAQCNLGRMYLAGFGVKKNATKAVRIFQLASEQGIAPAQHELAAAFEKGLGGLAPNSDRALELYSQAFANGFAPAELGMLRVRATCERRRRAREPFELYVDEAGLVTMHQRRRRGARVEAVFDAEDDGEAADDGSEGGSAPSAWRPGGRALSGGGGSAVAGANVSAARCIQSMARARSARNEARRALSRGWRKRRDAESNCWYYENLGTGMAQWETPVLFARLFPAEVW